jgi:hypothetical protein
MTLDMEKTRASLRRRRRRIGTSLLLKRLRDTSFPDRGPSRLKKLNPFSEGVNSDILDGVWRFRVRDTLKNQKMKRSRESV